MAGPPPDPFAQFIIADAGVQSASGTDAFVLVVGGRQSGKSTLVHRVGSSDEEVETKPTVALDYTPLRATSVGVSGGKYDIAHVYELGSSSTTLADLLQVPITPQRLPSSAIVLVLDLSQPAQLCATAARWLPVVHKRIAECLEKLQARKGAVDPSTTPEVLYRALDARLRLGYAQRTGASLPLPAVVLEGQEGQEGRGAALPPHAVWNPAVSAAIKAALPEHPDWKLISQCGVGHPDKGTHSPALPIPVLVVGNRWDVVKNSEGPRRKALLAALRYIGLCAGAAVVTTSCLGRDSQSLLPAFRQLFLGTVFGAAPRKGWSVSPEGDTQLVIPAGADTVEDILGSLGSGAAGNKSSTRPSTITRGSICGPGDLPSRLQPFHELIVHYYPEGEGAKGKGKEETHAQDSSAAPSVGPDGRWAFHDTAALTAPEPLIDALRAEKAEQVVRMQAAAKEKEKRIAAEVKAAASAKQ